MPSVEAAGALREALETLAAAVEALTYPTASSQQADRLAARDRVAWIVREYLLRRLADLEGALRVVLVGPTGSGASTILNTLAETDVSPAGPLRPTTTVPVVWCDPTLEPEFAFDFVTGFGTGPDARRPLRVVAHRHPLVSQLAIVDAPDFDSMQVEHREIAELLVDAADLCVLVVSRHRYADAAVWRFVEHLRGRPVRLVTVMNRFEDGDAPAVTDFRQRLRRAGFNEDPIVVIPEQQVDEHRRLPADAVLPIHEWLVGFGDPTHRRKVVVDSVSSTLGALFRHLDRLDAARHADLAEATRLREAATEIHRDVGAGLVEALARPGEIGDADLRALITRELERAGLLTRSAWRRLPGGAALAGREAEEFSFDIGQVLDAPAGPDEQAAVPALVRDGIEALFDEAGTHLAAMAQLPSQIGPLERAAAMVMETGKRFLDA